MSPFMNLAVVALAASVSPALSAPAPYKPEKPIDSNSASDDDETLVDSTSTSKSESTPSNDPVRDSKWIDAAKYAGVIVPGLAAIAGMEYYFFKPDESKNNTKRTFEAFEGRANAELVELPPDGHVIDKRLGPSDLVNRFFDALGTLAGSTATSPGVPRDVSHSQTIAASSVLGKRDFALEDTLHLFSRMLDELD